MRLSRIVIKNFRSFEHLDVAIPDGTTCIIGENNSGKSNLLHAIRMCMDAGLSSTFRSLVPSVAGGENPRLSGALAGLIAEYSG